MQAPHNTCQLSIGRQFLLKCPSLRSISIFNFVACLHFMQNVTLSHGQEPRNLVYLILPPEMCWCILGCKLCREDSGMVAVKCCTWLVAYRWDANNQNCHWKLLNHPLNYAILVSCWMSNSTDVIRKKTWLCSTTYHISLPIAIELACSIMHNA